MPNTARHFAFHRTPEGQTFTRAKATLINHERINDLLTHPGVIAETVPQAEALGALVAAGEAHAQLGEAAELLPDVAPFIERIQKEVQTILWLAAARAIRTDAMSEQAVQAIYDIPMTDRVATVLWNGRPAS